MFQVHILSNNGYQKPISCVVASYRDALKWARWFEDGTIGQTREWALRIVKLEA